MKTILILCLICCLGAFAAAPQSQVTAFTITKGSLSFDYGGVIFRAGNQVQHFRFSRPQISDSSIPGLQVTCFQQSALVSATGGPETDISALTLRGEDGRSISLTLCQEVEVYRVDITFSDLRQLTLWKPAWDTGPPAQSQYVTVTGGVFSPGRVVWKRGLTLLYAIASMGGTTDGFHTPQVFIVRGGQRIRVRLGPIINQQMADPPLQPGDQVDVAGRVGDLQ
jgi:hypothetical protein